MILGTYAVTRERRAREQIGYKIRNKTDGPRLSPDHGGSRLATDNETVNG